MVTIEQINKITKHQKIREFATFILGEWKDTPFPIAQNIDLIKVPGLVKCIWKMAYTEDSPDRVRATFSGSEVDHFWKFDISKTGLVDDLWEDKRHTEIVPDLYQAAVDRGQLAYTKRITHIRDGLVPKAARVEALMFPTASDGQTADGGIGYVDYYVKTEIKKNEYLLFGADGWEVFEKG